MLRMEFTAALVFCCLVAAGVGAVSHRRRKQALSEALNRFTRSLQEHREQNRVADLTNSEGGFATVRTLSVARHPRVGFQRWVPGDAGGEALGIGSASRAHAIAWQFLHDTRLPHIVLPQPASRARLTNLLYYSMFPFAHTHGSKSRSGSKTVVARRMQPDSSAWCFMSELGDTARRPRCASA